MMPLQNSVGDKLVVGEQLHEGASCGIEKAKTLQEKS